MVRRADGWIALGKSPADLSQPLATLREMAAKAGRKPDELHICMLPISTPTLEQVIEDIPHYAELGVQHLYLSMRAWTTEFSRFMELMARFADAAGLPAC